MLFILCLGFAGWSKPRPLSLRTFHAWPQNFNDSHVTVKNNSIFAKFPNTHFCPNENSDEKKENLGHYSSLHFSICFTNFLSAYDFVLSGQENVFYSVRLVNTAFTDTTFFNESKLLKTANHSKTRTVECFCDFVKTFSFFRSKIKLVPIKCRFALIPMKIYIRNHVKFLTPVRWIGKNFF